jgi:hypothetical protein
VRLIAATAARAQYRQHAKELKMTSRNEAFPSKYLKAADLKGRAVTLEIAAAPEETLTGFDGQSQTKTVVYFAGTKKKLPLNRTNWNAIADVTGEDDSDNWPGHKIELYPATTEMNGKTLPCIRVRTPAVRAVPPLAKSDAAAARTDAADDMSDTIPF